MRNKGQWKSKGSFPECSGSQNSAATFNSHTFTRGTDNVPMYPYEIPSRLSSLNMLDYSSQIMEGASLEDLDSNERERLRNIIKYRKGDKALLEFPWKKGQKFRRACVE